MSREESAGGPCGFESGSEEVRAHQLRIMDSSPEFRASGRVLRKVHECKRLFTTGDMRFITHYFVFIPDANFFFFALIQAAIRLRMPLSVHSLWSCSSRSISALICVISPGESMSRVYDTEQS
jgi:hypothetical protein